VWFDFAQHRLFGGGALASKLITRIILHGTTTMLKIILLSIQQTCKYKGVKFFEFLKSGEMSIFGFQEKANERHKII
jgi:hypothetical protein